VTVYQPEHKASLGHPVRSIFAYARPYAWDYLRGAILGAAFLLIDLAMPVVIRTVITAFQQDVMTPRLLGFYFIVLLGIASGTGVGRYYQRLLMIKASRKCEYDLRNDYFRHVQRLGQGFFHRNKTGDIMARAVNDLEYVRMFLGPGLMGSVDMIRVPLSLAVMTYFSAKLTLITIIPMPLVSVMVYAFITYIHRQSGVVQDQFARVTSRVQENLAGARVVKAYAAASREERDFRKECEAYMRQSMGLALVTNFAWVSVGTVVGLTILLVLWRGGLLVINGQLPLGDLVGFMVCVMMLAWPLAQFGWVMTLYQRGAVGMKRISEILAEEPAIRDDADTRYDLPPVKGAVTFERVRFGFESRPVLHDINLSVPQGKTVAIVGPTGSGKSSIVSLLTREYDPAEGRVFIDGVDARRIPVAKLREAIGYVPQDTFLFSDTIRANVTLGRPDAAQTEIDYACRAAQLHETIEGLEQGYDTLLGERGVNLSGGQKQRLAIARAILRDPKILVLDDALSSVDTHTEERILNGLKEVTTQRTSVIISHRVSTVRHADEIVVVDDGRIVERGTHADLLALGGAYAAMHARQQLEAQLEET
jgi:ATP-binding cassette subfamily B protein